MMIIIITLIIIITALVIIIMMIFFILGSLIINYAVLTEIQSEMKSKELESKEGSRISRRSI